MLWRRVLLCGALLWPLSAAGQPLREAPAAAAKEDAAMQHFQLGLQFYRAGDYAAALVEFEAAYGLSQHADLLHNLSWAAEKLGRIPAAIDYEERFLALKRGDLSLQELDLARGRLVRLRELQSGTPPPAAPALSPAPQPQAPPAEAPARAPWRPSTPALALTLSGAAALVAGIACGAAALDSSAQLHSGQAFTLREIDAMNTRGNALNGAAIALDTVGGVALAGGALWLVLDWKRSRDRGAEGVRAKAGAGVVLVGSVGWLRTGY